MRAWLALLFTTVAGVGLLLGSGFPWKAQAAVYWGNGSAIGRSTLDLTLADPYFVGAGNSPDLISACGVAVNGTHIYWADSYRGAIGRSKLDGSSPEYSFIAGVHEPCGVALDETYIYWANRGGGTIGRARLDGSERNIAFVHTFDPCGVAVDDDFIYWASAGGHFVGRALVKSGVEGPPLFVGDDDFHLCGVAVNEDHIFWGGFGGVIGRANLDGSDPDGSFIEGVDNACSLALNDDYIYWTEYDSGGYGRIGQARLGGAVINRDSIVDLVCPRFGRQVRA